MFLLTDTIQMSTHGKFDEIWQAKNYAIYLRQYGLCKEYHISHYVNNIYVICYDSVPKKETIDNER